MLNPALRAPAPKRLFLLLGALLLVFATSLPAQVPTQGRPQQLPSPEQAQRLLQNQPGLVEQLRQKLSQSGLSPDQVRSRLRAAGYPENLLDEYLPGRRHDGGGAARARARSTRCARSAFCRPRRPIRSR